MDDQNHRIVHRFSGVKPMTGCDIVMALAGDDGRMLGDHDLWRKTVPYEPSARYTSGGPARPHEFK